MKQADLLRAWMLGMLLACTSVAGAGGGEAILVHRQITPGGGLEVDAAVGVASIDGVPADPDADRTAVPAGRHVIEVLCTARVFVGMGTVDFPVRHTLEIEIGAGEVYRLDGKATVKGDCHPVIVPR